MYAVYTVFLTFHMVSWNCTRSTGQVKTHVIAHGKNSVNGQQHLDGVGVGIKSPSVCFYYSLAQCGQVTGWTLSNSDHRTKDYRYKIGIKHSILNVQT